MQNPRGKSESNSTRRTAVSSLVIIGLMFVGLIGFWWTTAMKTPVVAIPNPVMPHPNAFDFYVAAGNAVVGETQIGDAVGIKQTVVYSMTQKEALVQQNVGAIATLHQGFAYPYVNPPARSISFFFPYYAKFRGMARLLSLQGQTRAGRGDWSGAAESYLDAIRMGEDIPHRSVLIGELVGIACQAIGRRPLWSAVDHLTAAQSRAAGTRLASIMDRHFLYADTLQEEKWFGQSALLEMFTNTKQHNIAVTVGDPGTEQGNGAAQSLSSFLYLAYSKSRIMGNYTTYMDKSSELARQSYGLHLPAPSMPTDPINRSLLPVFAETQLKDVESETQNGLLLIVLALHTFRLEHGRYPASLQKLSPAYLKKLPEDPFAVQGTFKYKLQGKSYLLYSVGPDGNDDGGTPIDDVAQANNSNKNARYFVKQSSIGDVVAGKNMW